jgi:pimeloyl-[acyl-carrier protein] methyl ester esterase
VLLPGLDGSSALARRFLELKPADARVLALSLPPQPFRSYAELAERMRASLPEGPLLLIGNSFSGPLALRLANLIEPVGLVLCATYVTPPGPRWLTAPAWSFVLEARPSAVLVSLALTDGDVDLAIEVAEAVRLLPPEVVASRLRMALTVDARADLEHCRCPALVLWASRDLVLGQAELELMRRLRPGARFCELDSGHLLLQSRPRLAWAQIAEFVKSL